jgi:hypothetical protein
MQMPDLVGHKFTSFDSDWVQPMDIERDSV